MGDTRRRVKLYVLNDERQWDDRGTGHVSSCYVERLLGMSLLVRSETDGEVLLESKIQPDTAYQKQQETLIVWSENDNYDLALSFQEKAGCDEIWEIICQVQGKDPSVDITQDTFEEPAEEPVLDDMPDAAPPIELPPCELSKLDEISELFCQVLSSPIRREKLAIAIENETYISKLVELFRMCEDLENMDGLHHLYEIIKSTILLNKNSLLEIMFSDDLIYDVVGCLEYDPSVPSAHRHREYLNSKANFREVIPIQNHELLNKIHQTYRVQYIQDVILPTPSVFEENMLSTLHSFIYFNKMQIVSMIQEDDRFLPELFAQLTDENTEDGKRRDLVYFLKEFCKYAQDCQNRDGFFKALSNLGILPALEVVLSMDDVEMRQAAIDIFSYIVEFSSSMVREFIMQEVNTQDDDVLLINVLIEQMICDTDPDLGVAMQLMNILRILMDPENMMATVAVGNLPKTEKTEFLSFFYKHCMHVLTAPLLANTCEDKPSRDDFQTAQLLSLILELLTFTVEHHTYHIKNYIVNKDLLRRVLVLLKSQHQFLVLCAVRFFRRIIAMRDDFYNRYIIRGKLVEPVIRVFKNNGNKYNLLNSALIELFEFIRNEDIKSLIVHIVDAHGQFLDGVDYVTTFKGIKLNYEQHIDRQNSKPSVDLRHSTILQNSRFRRDARTLEEEEELWFEQEEDCDENDETLVMAGAPFHTTTKVDNELDSIGRFIDSRKIGTENTSPPHLNKADTQPSSPTTTATALASNGRPGSPLQQQQQQATAKSPPSVRAVTPVRPSSPPVGTSLGKMAAVVVVNTTDVENTNSTKVVATTPATTTATTTTEIKAANSVVASKQGAKMVGLVDYDEDSDEDDDEDEEPPTKRLRLTS